MPREGKIVCCPASLLPLLHTTHPLAFWTSSTTPSLVLWIPSSGHVFHLLKGLCSSPHSMTSVEITYLASVRNHSALPSTPHLCWPGFACASTVCPKAGWPSPLHLQKFCGSWNISFLILTKGWGRFLSSDVPKPLCIFFKMKCPLVFFLFFITKAKHTQYRNIRIRPTSKKNVTQNFTHQQQLVALF